MTGISRSAAATHETRARATAEVEKRIVSCARSQLSSTAAMRELKLTGGPSGPWRVLHLPPHFIQPDYTLVRRHPL